MIFGINWPYIKSWIAMAAPSTCELVPVVFKTTDGQSQNTHDTWYNKHPPKTQIDVTSNSKFMNYWRTTASTNCEDMVHSFPCIHVTPTQWYLRAAILTLNFLFPRKCLKNHTVREMTNPSLANERITSTGII